MGCKRVSRSCHASAARQGHALAQFAIGTHRCLAAAHHRQLGPESQMNKMVVLETRKQCTVLGMSLDKLHFVHDVGARPHKFHSENSSCVFSLASY